MTLPRPVYPESIVFITRRCTQRQFLLTPDHEEVNNAFVYCLAEAAERFGMEIILSQMMSNHHHTVLFDRHGREPEFREHFHRTLAKTMNAMRGRWENLWSTEETCKIEILRASDLLDKLVYVATNPVKDGLVEKVHQWPGPKLVVALLTGQPIRATRPRRYFDEEGEMPRELELSLRMPDHFPDRERFLDELRVRISEAEDRLSRARQKAGRFVIGRRRIKRQSWRDCPSSFEPRRNLRPRVAVRNKWARIEALQRNAAWQEDYRVARKLWLAGFENVMFPFGTYWLRRVARVPVLPRTEPAPFAVH